MSIDSIFSDIASEVGKAEMKFPGWPEDPVHGSAIISEEAGELTQSCLDWYYLRQSESRKMRKEALHVAAMAIRFLINFEHLRRDKGGHRSDGT